jgi:hypothetical protein
MHNCRTGQCLLMCRSCMIKFSVVAMISIASPNKGLAVIAVFAVLAFLLLPVCPLSLPDASGSGCHSESTPDAPDKPDMPDMPSPQQQSCCFVAAHFQPGILNAGPTVSFAAIAMVNETSASDLIQISLTPELNAFRPDFSPPLSAVLRV